MPKLAEKTLTDISIKRLSSGELPHLEIRDAAIRGLIVRVYKSGKKTWFAMARAPSSKQHRERLGTYPEMTLSEAREKATEALRAIRRGIPAQQRRQSTIGALFELWIEQDQAHKKGGKEVHRAMQKDILPSLGSREASSITTRDISEVLAEFRKRGHNSHADHLLGYTKRMFNWAVEHGYLTSNPAASLKKGSPTKRTRVLSLSELREVWQATDRLGYPYGPFFRLLMLTGQRRDEVAELQWSEINQAIGTWTLPASRAKNGKTHEVPLSPTALSVIADIQQGFQNEGKPLSGYVFTTTGTTPISGFSKAKARLDKLKNIPQWNIHDLRRSFATQAAEELGGAADVIELCLNHISGVRAGVAGIYNHSKKMADRRALHASWDELITTV